MSSTSADKVHKVVKEVGIDRLKQFMPDQSQRDKLDRFETLTRGGTQSSPNQRNNTKMLFQVLEDYGKDDITPTLVHGPMYGVENPNSPKVKVPLLDELGEAGTAGRRHKVWEKYQDLAAAKDPYYKYDARSINLCFPTLMASDNQMPFFTNTVILSHPEDCERIAKAHIKKQPNFTTVFFQSLIATTDNVHWAKQRSYLNEVFLPGASLSKIFPISFKRAQHCAVRLGELSKNAGKYGVEMHDFFLHEAQAQLQLALFGMDEKFMNSTNQSIRQVFNGTYPDPDKHFGSQMVLDMLKKVGENDAFATATDIDVINGTKDVFGPLSKAVVNASKDLNMNLYDQFGNMLLILFAGHDTTAHTMTWLTYELARNPTYLKRVQKEVDDMFQGLNGQPMKYEDCAKLPFLTKCIMETLRKWTAVPNGTFRELQYDDEIHGPGGKMVELKKGTYVQVVNWMRHRNPTLWGDDVNEFNPDRKWQGNEIWGMSSDADSNGEGAFHGSNPASPRFSPFTFTPRDCLGKNFAQMEMRTILANVFHKYDFILSEPYADENIQKNGFIENVKGTMGPRDMTPEGLKETKERLKGKEGSPKQPCMAMYLHVVPRKSSKL
jgi:cytochrome P450